jgi:hypothetical protein
MKRIGLLILCLFALVACAGNAAVSSRAVEPEKIDVTVAPGKIHEVCYELAKGQGIEYRFQSSRTMDFNLHFHEGTVIEYPVEKNAVQKAEGSYTAVKDQIYCLMWTNRHPDPCTLEGSVKLLRQSKP